jgi:hypothetical protein
MAERILGMKRFGHGGGGVGVLAVTVLWAGCGLVDPPNCTASIEPAVVVWIYDGVTGEPAAHGAQGWVRDGDYTDPLIPYHMATGDPASVVSMRAADERPGTYDVHVEKAGYLPWVETGVRARSGVCHVRTVELVANLVRQEP